MQTFEWVDAKSLEQAGQLLGESTPQKPVMLKAGGMDLLDLMKEGIIAPSRLVNLKSIPGLDTIERGTFGLKDRIQPESLRIGALVTLHTLAEHPMVREHVPALAEAAGHAATPQVRNAATIGGNLMQRPRCWYYRHDHFHQLEGDPFKWIREGQNQYHGIFDTDQSPMAQASTPATALTAYDAEIEILRDNRTDTLVPIRELYVPAKMDGPHMSLQPADVICAIRVPIQRAGTKSAYTKQTERESYDWPICDCAVVLQMDGQTVKQASIVMGWVAPTPRRAKEAEAVLVGKALTEDLARQAAKAAVADARPLSKNAYKVPILETVVRRTIMKCV
jgi:xanthine dehydrogenase YagS FAD-binding subunit